MTQYGGYYATGPGSYDYESAGGYDPYAAAAAGAVGATVGGAAVGAAAAGTNRNSLVSNPGVAGLGGNERFATQHGEPIAGAGAGGYAHNNESQYYLDPQEYDYDRTPENERYMDDPAHGGHGGVGYAEPYVPQHSGQHEQQHGGQHDLMEETITDDEMDYNGRRGLRVSLRYATRTASLLTRVVCSDREPFGRVIDAATRLTATFTHGQCLTLRSTKTRSDIVTVPGYALSDSASRLCALDASTTTRL